MVNGIDTKPGEYSVHTQVGCCSGALIAPDVVLTAGHDVPPEPVGMIVTIGAYYSSVTAKQGEPRTVTQAIRHPGYDAIHNDFCILILDGPSENAQPIPINRSPLIPQPYQEVTLLGTGTFNLSTSVRSVVLQEATSNYIPNDECSEAYDPERGVSYAGGFLDDTNLCTKGVGDGCIFDSGGPVLVDGLLIGLISYGVDCNDPVYPAVNARVSAVHDWIDKIVCRYSKYIPKDFDCSSQTTTVGSIALLGELMGASTGREEVFQISRGKLVLLVVLLGFVLVVMISLFRPKTNAPRGSYHEERPLLPSSRQMTTDCER
jgi:secreted trypsin-like serine protease